MMSSNSLKEFVRDVTPDHMPDPILRDAYATFIKSRKDFLDLLPSEYEENRAESMRVKYSLAPRDRTRTDPFDVDDI